MDKERELNSCDLIKILMMLLVIIYHSCALWTNGGWFNQIPINNNQVLGNISIWLGSIHIYTFTFISGYLFYYLRYECGKYNDFKKSVIKRGQRLLIPYISTSIIWCIPFYIIYFGGNVKDIFKKYFLAVSPSQLWFLIMIFGVFVIFYIISDFFNKLTLKKSIFFLLTIYLLYFALKSLGVPNIFQIISITRHLIFFGMGFLFRKYDTSKMYRINYVNLILINLILLSIYLSIYRDNSNFLLENIIYLGMNITGILLVILAVNKVYERINKESISFKFLKKYNFTMYLFHQQIIYICIDLLNGKINSYLLAIISLIIAVISSGLISYIISLNRCTRIMFGLETI